MSSLLINVPCDPVPIRRPRLIAALWPPSGSLTQYVSHRSYFFMISTDPSLLPPSSTKYSRFGYPWSRIDRSVASRKSACLKEGVTTVMHGQAWPSGISLSNDSLPSVQGQPVFPGGGAGSSCMLGQRIQSSSRDRLF